MAAVNELWYHSVDVYCIFTIKLQSCVGAWVMAICDPIFEIHTSKYMQNFWEFSIENFSDFLKINFFTYSDKATIKPSCCEISHP